MTNPGGRRDPLGVGGFQEKKKGEGSQNAEAAMRFASASALKNYYIQGFLEVPADVKLLLDPGGRFASEIAVGGFRSKTTVT